MNKIHYGIYTGSLSTIKNGFEENPQLLLEKLGSDNECINALPIFHIAKNPKFIQDIDFLFDIINYTISNSDEKNKVIDAIVEFDIDELNTQECTIRFYRIILDNIQLIDGKFDKSILENFIHNSHHSLHDNTKNTLIGDDELIKKYYDLLKTITFEDITNCTYYSYCHLCSQYINLIKTAKERLNFSREDINQYIIDFLKLPNPSKNTINMNDYGWSKENLYLAKEFVFYNYYKLFIDKETKIFDIDAQSFFKFCIDMQSYDTRNNNNEDDYSENQINKTDRQKVDTLESFCSVFSDKFDFNNKIDEYLQLCHKEIDDLKEIDDEVLKEHLLYDFLGLFWILEHNKYEFFEEFYYRHYHILHLMTQTNHQYMNDDTVSKLWEYGLKNNHINAFDISIVDCYNVKNEDNLTKIYQNTLSTIEKEKIDNSVEQKKLKKKSNNNNFKI